MEEKIKATLFIDYDRSGNMSAEKVKEFSEKVLKSWETFYGFSSEKYAPVLYINPDDDRDVYNWRREEGWPELGISAGHSVPAGFPLSLLTGKENGDIIEITVMGDKELSLTIEK